VLDHPAALCAQLARNELDMALVSSFEFLRNPIYRIVDHVSICSAGPVYSVFVAHRGDISEIEEIELDPASQTSVNLLRCLLGELQLSPRFAFGLGSAKEPIAMPRQAAKADRPAACAPQTKAQLLIGDQAIRFRQEQGDKLKYWDLGEQWARMTDRPFVYALWLVRPEVADVRTIGNRLRSLRDKNLASLDRLVAEKNDFDHDFCQRYYREHLRFNLGEAEKEGLKEFHRLCETQGLLPKRKIEFNFV
jgi:chorismate dehydratase